MKENEIVIDRPAAALQPANPQVPGESGMAGDKVERGIRRYAPEYRDDLRWVWHWGLERKYSQSEIAEALGISPTTYSRVLNGLYTNRTGELIAPPAQMLSAIRALRIREADALEKDSRYVRTPTVDRIWAYLNMIAGRDSAGNYVEGERRGMGYIFGESQIGKTSAAVWYKERHNHGRTLYMTLQGIRTSTELWRELARTMYVSAEGNQSRLKQRVIEAATNNPSLLLIVDEVHWVLSYALRTQVIGIIEGLRALRDRSGCAMCFISTNVGREAMTKGPESRLLQQVWKRAIVPLQLERYNPIADVRAVFRHFGFPFPASPDSRRDSRGRNLDTWERALSQSRDQANACVRLFFDLTVERGLEAVFGVLAKAARLASRNGAEKNESLLLATAAGIFAYDSPEDVL